MIKYRYSLIRYMPDARRQEVINIGLVVFRDVGVDVRVLGSSTKVRLIDGGSEQDDLNSLQEQFIELCALTNSPEEQFKILSLFNGRTSISERGEFILDQVQEYDVKVGKLFDLLVKPRSFKKRSPSSSRFTTSIKNKFKALEILASDISELGHHKVVHNYPISESSGITADFLLRNGAYHLTETIDYDKNDVNAKFKETTLKLMTFMEANKAFDNGVKKYFVFKAASNRELEMSQQINLAESYSDKIFNFESKDDEAKYFQIVSDAIGMELPLVH